VVGIDTVITSMCRDILNTCVRNTEEAEKSSHAPTGSNTGTSGRGHGRGVWGMIDESELAKRIRQDEAKKVLIPSISSY
jgi:protein phosphatase 1 regulatory subunit 37